MKGSGNTVIVAKIAERKKTEMAAIVIMNVPIPKFLRQK